VTELPYRPNVGAVLFNHDGKVFVARRADLPNAEGVPGGWQLPQGGIDPNEDPRAAVLRELEEEIGVQAEKIEFLSEFYVSPGFLAEKMFVFMATGLTDVGQKLEDDELISIERLSFPQAFEMIRNGEIEDAKTMVGLIFAGGRFGYSLDNR